jgi:large subunit ribosomal protein L22
MILMKEWRYSLRLEDESRIAKAVARDASVSYKKLVNLARVIKGMKLQEAFTYLENVMEKRQPVPQWRYHGKTPHHKGAPELGKVPYAKYPVKAAKIMYKLLKNVEANAENKDLDTDNLWIIHVGVHKSMTLKRVMPRAYGRSTPKYRRLSHIEVIVEERR